MYPARATTSGLTAHNIRQGHWPRPEQRSIAGHTQRENSACRAVTFQVRQFATDSTGVGVRILPTLRRSPMPLDGAFSIGIFLGMMSIRSTNDHRSQSSSRTSHASTSPIGLMKTCGGMIHHHHLLLLRMATYRPEGGIRSRRPIVPT